MDSIRINENLVLQIHPEASVLKTSVNWMDADPDDVLLDLFSILGDWFSAYHEKISNEAYLVTSRRQDNIKLRQSLLRMHEEVGHLGELLSRLLAEQTKK